MQSRATDLGSRSTLIAVGGGWERSGHEDTNIDVLTSMYLGLGAYSLEAYDLGQPIWVVAAHSWRWLGELGS